MSTGRPNVVTNPLVSTGRPNVATMNMIASPGEYLVVPDVASRCSGGYSHQ